MAGLFIVLWTVFAVPAMATDPNIIFILLDDMGMSAMKFAADLLWRHGTECTNSTFERDPNVNFAPHINELAKNGIILENYYAYTSCTPSRQSLMSGRLPAQLGVMLGEPQQWDGGSNTTWGMDGLPTNLTIFPALLQQKRGYDTHMVGKGDGFGTVTPLHLPINRGFNSTLHYHNHANDMFDYSIGPLSVGLPPPCPLSPFIADLWENHGPRNQTKYPKGVYEDTHFTNRVLEIIRNHNIAKPLFVYWSPHIPHTPLQLPRDGDRSLNSGAKDYFGDVAQKMCNYNPKCQNPDGTCWLNCSAFSGPNQWYSCLLAKSLTSPRGECASIDRIQYLASIAYIDDAIKLVTTALEDRNMWNNTVLIFTSDNGGGIGLGPGGNNYPLRGGKGGMFDGGWHVPAFISGGLIPGNRRGSVFKPLMHVSDWYTSLVAQGNGKPVVDERGNSAGIVAPQNLDFWGHIVNARNDELRRDIWLSPGAYMKHDGSRWLKVIQGITSNNLFQGPDFPNSTCDNQNEMNTFQCRVLNPAPIGNLTNIYDCGAMGCLFDISADPGEHTELNNTNDNAIRASMIATLKLLNRGYNEPWRGCQQNRLWCNAAQTLYGNTYGPFVDVPNCPNVLTCVNSSQVNRTLYPKTNSSTNCSESIIGVDV